MKTPFSPFRTGAWYQIHFDATPALWHNPPMQPFTERVLRLFQDIHPLDQIPRAGFVLRGVPAPESVSAHSHFVSVMTLLYLDQFPGIYDRERALTMALVHDLCEARLMDIPMPVADAHLRRAKDEAELAITADLFAGFTERYSQSLREFLDATTPEARLVRGLDKAQMMIKILMYEREGKGRLKEFWLNPKNFNDYGVAAVSDLFDAICEQAGRPRPR